VLADNAAAAKQLIAEIAPHIGRRTEPCGAGCHHALDTAIITPPEARDPAMVRKLSAVAGRVLGG
jgi:5'-methylthioadenosine phosphorylase